MKKLQVFVLPALLLFSRPVQAALLKAAPKSAGTQAPARASSPGTLGNPSSATSAPPLTKTPELSKPDSTAVQTPASQKLAPGSPTFTDRGVEEMGGRIFSTGTEDIKVKIISLTARTSPRNTIGGRLTDQPVESAFNNGIYLFSPAPEHFIGFSRQHGRVVNLGKLPAGELVFGIKTPQNYRFQTGAASKNPDHVPHAIVKSFVSGTMEVWFEDEAGVRLPASDRDFNDAVIELSGGITRDSSVTDLLSLIHEQKGEAREKAIAELKKLDPKTALQAGLR